MREPFIWENPAFLTRVDEWLLNGNPDQNAIDWNLDSWASEFPEHKDFLKRLYLTYLGFLNRDIVKKTVQDESENMHSEEGFLTVMIWGYAGDSRGPHRTKQILSQENAKTSIEAAYVALMEGNIKAAYSALVENGPKYLGPAFATKYLYFASQESVKPTPLILDSQVAEGLARWGNSLYNSVTASADDYLGYLEYMEVAATKIGIREENLEFLIFSENAKLKGNQSWANRPIGMDLKTTEKRAWAILLTAEILLRDLNLVAYYSQPGGGQYDCISIRELEKKTGFEADLNVVGGIHFFRPVRNYYPWESLISRGVSGLCEMLAEVYGWEHSVNLANATPWAKSFRTMAQWAINTVTDESTRYECLVVDNSAYGLSIDASVFKLFPAADAARDDCPNLLELPKEAWFWKVTLGDEAVGLINIFDGVHYFISEEEQELDWPN